jgi:hypothetical protein
MSNDQMTAGRFLRWAQARKRIAAIKSHLASGGVVIVATHLKAAQYDGARFVDSFKATRSGAFVRRGKNWDCIDGCAVKFGRWQ